MPPNLRVAAGVVGTSPYGARGLVLWPCAARSGCVLELRLLAQGGGNGKLIYSGPMRAAQLSGKEEVWGSPPNKRLCLEARLASLRAGERTERGFVWAWGKHLSEGR